MEKISRERLTSELLHYMRETEALRSERTRLEIELSKTKDELNPIRNVGKQVAIPLMRSTYHWRMYNVVQ